MNTNEYQAAVMRTCGQSDERDRIIMAVMGIAGESGEIADFVKKAMYHDHEPDMEKLKLEIGDLFWYVGLLCNTLNFTFDEIMERNIEKLRKRYPNGFEAERSIHREEGEL